MMNGSSAQWLASLLGRLVVFVAVGLGAAAAVRGAEQPEASDVLRFRRVYAPADRLIEWPRDREKYLPVDQAEFDRLVAAVVGRSGEPERRIAAAEYRARWTARAMLEGRAELHVPHSGDLPAMIPIAPLGLAIRSPHWAGEPPTPAALGTAPGGCVLLVEREGTLEFDWSLAGRADPRGTAHFTIELPACPANRLVLDLPEPLAPTVDVGLVRLETAAQGEAPPPGLRRWRIELGGNSRCALSVATPGESAPARWTVLKQSTVYDLTPRGVEVVAEYSLQSGQPGAGSLRMRVEPPLQLVSVMLGNEPLGWMRDAATAEDSSAIAVQLPETLPSPTPPLQLRALAPARLEENWLLPRIWPSDVDWQEGEITILVGAPLVLEHFAPRDCRQSGVGPLPAPRDGQSMRLQCFRPDAGAEVRLAPSEDPVEVSSGATVDVGLGEVRARVVADFRAGGRERFTVEGRVGPQWRVESVESVPAEAIEDWTVEGGSPQRRLVVRFAKPLAPGRPLRLVITARRLSLGLDRPMAFEEFVPLRLAGRSTAALVSLAAAEPLRLRAVGPGAPESLEYAALSAEQQNLLNGARGWILRDDAEAAGLRIVPETLAASYTAAVRVEARVGADRLEEQYTLRCEPRSPRLDRVVVRFTPARDQPPRFRLVGGEDDDLVARRRADGANPVSAPPTDEAGNPAANGEVWELELSRPMDGPFEIRAERAVPLDRVADVSLASLEDAAAQSGTVEVSRSGAVEVRVDSSRLEAIPVEPVPAGSVQTRCAAYRYYPATSLDSGSPPRLVVAVDKQIAAALWVWQLHVQSWYGAAGPSRHVATYRIENAAAEELTLRWPEGLDPADVLAVRVDGRGAAWRLVNADSGEMAIPLPPARRFSTVAVHFEMPFAGLGDVGRIAFPALEPAGPVLSRRWTAWLPPGYRLGDDAEGCASPGDNLAGAIVHRLAGPLAREPNRVLFDPLRWSSWSWRGADAARLAAAETLADRLVRAAGALAVSSAAADEGVLTWARLLSHPSLQSSDRTLLVDAVALGELGIAPEHLTPRVEAGEAAEAGADLFDRSELEWLVSPDVALLTSRVQAARWRDHLQPLDTGVGWAVVPGWLARRMRDAAETPAPSMVPASVWVAQGSSAANPWTTTDPMRPQSADTAGWVAHDRNLPAKGIATADYVRRPSAALWATAATLLVAGAVGSARRRFSRRLWVALATIGAVIALSIPERWAPAATAALLGLCVGAVVQVWRTGRAPADSHGQFGPRRWLATLGKHWRHGGAVALVATTFWAMAGDARAEGPAEITDSASAVAGRAEPYRVFIPIDDQQQVVGRRYYVPDALYRELHRRAGLTGAEPGGWMLLAAGYRGRLSAQVTDERLGLDMLKAAFDLLVSHSPATIRIPLNRREIGLLPDGATLDGSPVQIDWETDGSALVFDVADAGRHRLELNIRPTAARGEPAGGVDLSIPPVAAAQFELENPPAGLSIDVPTARGRVERREDPPRWVAELGATDRLVVRWGGPNGAAAAQAVEADELYWLHFQPGSVVLEMQVVLDLGQARLDRFDLVVPSALRMLPIEQPDAPRVESAAASPGRQTISLRWSSPISGRKTVRARFLVVGASGIGNLRLPTVEVVGARGGRRWLALSADASLEVELTDLRQLEAMSVPDFAEQWGASTDSPRAAYRLLAPEAACVFATRARPCKTTAEEQLSLSFDAAGAEVDYEAALDTTVGYVFQYRLKAEAGLRIDHLSIQRDGDEETVRWTLEPDGTVQAWLDAPASGAHRLRLTGRVTDTGRQRRPIPLVRLDGVEASSYVLTLYRRPAVLVHVEPGGALRALEVPPVEGSARGSAQRDRGRLVGAYSVDCANIGQARLAVEPNEPRYRGAQVTWFWRAGGAWHVELDGRVDLVEGVLDQLRFRAPLSFGEPYRAVGAPGVSDVTGPNDTHELFIRPPTAISGRYEYRLGGTYHPQPSRPLEVPDVVLEGAEPLERFIVLPATAEGQPLAWRTEGLVPAELPEGFAALGGPAPVAVYRAVSARPVARLRPAPLSGRAARIRLADIRVAWENDGSYWGHAAFDLEPDDRSEYSLWLPDGAQLIHLRVGDVPTRAAPAGRGVWRFRLGPVRLPQRIDVVFEGIRSAAPAAGGPFTLAAPSLGEVPVAATLWTVAAPEGHGAAPQASATSVEPWRQELTRLKSIAATLQLAATLAEAGGAEAAHWYRPWAVRWAAVRRRAEREMTLAATLGNWRGVRLALTEARAIDREQADLAARLGTGPLLSSLLLRPGEATSPENLWQSNLGPNRELSYYIVPSPSPSLRLSYPAAGSSCGARLLWAAIACGLALPIASWLASRPACMWWLKKWPHVAGVLIGLAWWLWLWPGALGWAIVLASLAGAWRWPWKPAETPPSSVIALSALGADRVLGAAPAVGGDPRG